MTAATALRSRHLLGIEELEPGEIELVLDTALAMKEVGARPIKKVPTLRGRTVVNLFFEPSTRTRMSFELAEKRLSADTLGMTTSGSSVVKGETLYDTARTLEAMAPDMIVMRHSSSGAAHQLARVCRASIINAGDGMHEHPTQALLDAFTIREHKGRLAGLRVAIVGDLQHSRVLRSNVWLLTKMGATVVACAPATLMPVGLASLGVHVTTSMDEAVEGADVVMMLRVQHERMHGLFLPSIREYFALFGLTPARMARARLGGHRDAPGAHEPRRGNRLRGRRRAVVRDSRAGRQRRGRADGRAVSAGRGRAMTSMLLKAVHVVDPAAGRNGRFDVLIEAGRVTRVGRDLPAGAARIVELPASCVVTPGLIDIHVHLREPGQEHKETIATGTASAVAGGFTAVACMPNTDPINDNASVTQFILKRAAEANLARVYPIGAVSIGQKGEQLAEIGDLKNAGCVAITDDGRPVATALLMRRALEYATMFGDSGHRSLRRSVAQGRRRGARGRRGGDARPARHSRRRRVGHGRARHLGRRADRRPRAHRAHERAPVAAGRARRQGARRPRDRARSRRITSC